MQCLFDELRLVFSMLLRQLPKHQNTVMLKYCIIDCLRTSGHRKFRKNWDPFFKTTFTSLTFAPTPPYGQSHSNNSSGFDVSRVKLVIIMLVSVFDM